MLTVMLIPGVPSASLSAVLPDNTSGLVNPVLMIAPVVLLGLVGLRDKTIFLAARSERYLPALLFFGVLGFVDMIIALKLLICIAGVCAGISKFGHHFSCVVAPMVSNTRWVLGRAVRRLHYRDFPDDIRPSRVASLLAPRRPARRRLARRRLVRRRLGRRRLTRKLPCDPGRPGHSFPARPARVRARSADRCCAAYALAVRAREVGRE